MPHVPWTNLSNTLHTNVSPAHNLEIMLNFNRRLEIRNEWITGIFLKLPLPLTHCTMYCLVAKQLLNKQVHI